MEVQNRTFGCMMAMRGKTTHCNRMAQPNARSDNRHADTKGSRKREAHRTSGVARSASFNGVGREPPQRPHPIASRNPIHLFDRRMQQQTEEGTVTVGMPSSPREPSLVGIDDKVSPSPLTS